MFGNQRLSDQQLISLIRNGDKQALVWLYDRNYEGVRNYILRNSGSQDDVEDVLQDAVIITWQKVNDSDFELTSRLSTYVYAVAKNLWYKQLARRSRQQPLDESHTENMAGGMDWTSMDRKRVVEMVNRLGDSCRDMLTWFYFDGLNMTLIAEKLGLANADTAKAKKYQCLKKLEQMVKQQFTKSDFIG